MSAVFIIAEAGVNHNGDLSLAKKLVDIAAEAGANAVKFQTFKADRLVTPTAAKADYQSKNDSRETSQFEMLKRLELSPDDHREIIDYCLRKNIIFMSTPFDLESIDLLNSLGMNYFKIPSGEITNLPYLRKIGSLKKEVILSTGMSTLDDVSLALNILLDCGMSKKQITVLHATTEYPCPMSEVNLRAMCTMGQDLGVKIGYSDHTEGIEIPIAAVALGAKVIEKHITLDRTMEGPDHKASIEPPELLEMVRCIRNLEKALGDGIKRPTLSEMKNMVVARKSIKARVDIQKGEKLTNSNICVLRPGDGKSPMLWDDILGTEASKDYLAGENI